MTTYNLPKKYVLVEFPSKVSKQFPWPVLASDIAKDDEFKNIKNIVALKVNQLLVNLNCSIRYQKVKVEAVSLDSFLGHKIFLRSLVFLFGMACHLEYPKAYLTIEHHLPNGMKSDKF
jgi:hypothetical protein